MTENPPSRQPPHDLARAAAEVAGLLEVLWEPGGDAVRTAAVSTSQLRVLRSLDREEGINLRRLGELLDSAPSSVSRLCDRLQTMGLLARTPSPVSRRELELRLTPKARKYLAELLGHREQVLLPVLERMPANARRDLLNGLLGFRSAARGQGQEHERPQPPAGGDAPPA